jgi:hypothetical protein
MKRILMTDETYDELIIMLADLEIFLLSDGESTKELERVRSVIKRAESVNDALSGK